MTVDADLTDSVVLKAGNAFLVTTPAGELPLEGFHAFGLYRDDCRFLRGHELRLGGTRPQLLLAAAASGTEEVHELTNEDLPLPGGGTLPLQTLRIRVERGLAGEAAMTERVHVHLYGREPVAALPVEIALGAAPPPRTAPSGAASRSPRSPSRSRSTRPSARWSRCTARPTSPRPRSRARPS